MADVPMPRLPNYRRYRVRRREDVAASAVAAVLRAEGRLVENPFRPVEGQTRSPDWMMTVAGEPTALDVARLLPPSPRPEGAERRYPHRDRHARVPGARHRRSRRAGPALARVLRPGRADRRRDSLASDTRILASEVRQTLQRLVEGSEPVEIRSPIRWVLRAEVTLLPGPRDGFYILQAPDEGAAGPRLLRGANRRLHG